MKAVANFSAVKSASSTGINCARFVRGSIIVTTALWPASDVGNLVTKSIFTCSACSSGIGSGCRSLYGLVFLCLIRWHSSHPAIHSVIESVNFGQCYREATAAVVLAILLYPPARIASCASRTTSAPMDFGIHSFPPDGLWNRRPSSSMYDFARYLIQRVCFELAFLFSFSSVLLRYCRMGPKIAFAA